MPDWRVGVVMMNQFSAFDVGSVRGIPKCPTVEEAKDLGAVAVQRERENSGTFLVNADEYPVAYVSNGASLNGVWMYYSDAVAMHYGLRTFRDAT